MPGGEPKPLEEKIMTDERERRFRARINLQTGKAEVTEDHPVDRRTAATIPSQIQVPERAEPPHTVEPTTQPLFPWMRTASTPQPVQQSVQPQPQETAVVEPQSVGAPPDDPLAWARTPAPWDGFAEQLEQQQSRTRTELDRLEESFIERATEKVLHRLRPMLGLPVEEPSVAQPVVDVDVDVSNATMYHPAGAFASTPRPREYHPAGAFANRDATR